jgi:hypothetical protein
MMSEQHKTLGLQEGASQKEIQTAYDRLSKELDPKNNDNQEFFVEEYKKVQEAYDALSNSTILATERGSELSNTTKISTEENNREPSNNGKDLKSVKNWKGYFVFIFFLLVGLGPSTVVYYYYNWPVLGNRLYRRNEFLQMDFFNQLLYCFKQSIVDVGYQKNYFLFILVFIVILSIFFLFQLKSKFQKKSEKKLKKLKSKEVLEKIKRYKELVDLDVISKVEYTNLVKEYRSMLLKDIDKE